jgi:hypothetical protein
MSKLILDPETSSKLQSLTGPVELCNDSGRTLGYFTPAEDRSLYEGVEIPFTEEELRRAEQSTGTLYDGGGARLPEEPGDVRDVHRPVGSDGAESSRNDLMQASDREAITAAVRRIDQRLRHDPEDQGESRDQGRRILLETPLGVTVTVQPDDRTVSVLTVWHFDRRP